MNTSEIPTVRLEIGPDHIARLTLDQPNSRANVLSRTTWEQLGAACRTLASRTDVRGLLLQSAKPGIFIAGADLRELAALPTDDPGPTRELVRRGLEVLDALENLPFPTVAVIDGAALGGGLEVALACDFRLAGSNPKAKLGLPEVKLGLIPGWGGTQRLPRLIGLTAAAPLVCTGETLTGDSALALGLAVDLVPSEQLAAASVELVELESTSPTWYEVRHCKQSPCPPAEPPADLPARIEALSDDERPAGQAALRVLIGGAPLPLADATRVETDEFVPLVASAAARRRIDAFLKR